MFKLISKRVYLLVELDAKILHMIPHTRLVLNAFILETSIVFQYTIFCR
jgi:hypothetical protein